MSILVVDDEVDVRDSLQALLEAAGHAVVTASSGFEAIKCLTRGDIKLMLVDFSMPGMSGEEFLRKAWAIKQWPPALVITGVAPWRTLDLIELGVGYIRKPINSSLLLGTIETHLKKEDYDGRKIVSRVNNTAVHGRPFGCEPQG